MDNKEFTHLDLPVVSKEINPIEKLTQEIRTTIDPKTKKQGEFSVNFGEINNMGVDKRIKTFDNSTPFLDVYKPLNSGEVVSMYEKFTPGIDNNERLAQNQSGWEQTINGLSKAGANIGSVVLGNTAGFVYGLADWARTGNFNSVFDNSFSQTLNEWNEKLGYQLPNYYTKQEKEAGFFGSLVENPANFIANDLFNGISFTVGTIISEGIWAYATGGASLAVRAGRIGAKLGQIGRGAKELTSAVRAGETLAGAGKFGKAILGTEKVADGLANYKGFVYQALDNAVATGKMNKGLANAFAKGGEILNTTRFIGTSSGNEAVIEAFHFKKEATENFYRNFEELNGRPPTAEESAEMLDKIEGAANNVFASNMAILGVSNLAMLGGMFNLKSPISGLQKAVNQKLFGIGVKEASIGGELVFKGLERKAWQKGAGLLYKGTSPFVREGMFEEGLQGVTTKTANNWIERQYDPKYLNKIASLSDDAWKAMGEQYGTKAGWKEIGIGGLVGIAGGVATGEFSQFSKMAEQQEKVVAKSLNAANVTMKTFVSDINAGRMMTMAKVMESEDRAEQAMTKRDVVSAKLAHNDSMIALAEMYNNPLYGTGGLEQMERHGNNMIDTTEVSEQEKQELKAGFKSFIGEYKSANNFANSIVGSQGRIYGTKFQASDVQKALTYTILQGQSSKKMMDESLAEIGGFMGKDKQDAIKRNEDLQSLDKDTRAKFNQLAKEHQALKTRSEALQKKIQLAQISVKEGQESRLPALQREILEVEKRKLEINGELEVIAGKIATNKKLESSFGKELKDIPMTDEFISVKDLLGVEKSLTELEEAYKTLEAINPVSAQAVRESMSNYQRAQKALLDHNSAIKLIASGKFKPQLADTNPFSGIYKKFAKGEEKADEHTSQFLTRLNEIRNSYIKNVVGVGQEKDVEKYQAELAELSKKKKEDLTEDEVKRIQFLIENITILQKDAKSPAKIQAKIDELEKELAAIEDDNDPRIEEIDTLISELEKELKGTAEPVKNDTPSRENKNKQKVEELTGRIKALEEELKNTPENVTIEGTQSDIEAKKAEISVLEKQLEDVKNTVRPQAIEVLDENGNVINTSDDVVNLSNKIKEKQAELKALKEQPKVSEAGVQISADDIGLDDAFETEPKVENQSDIQAKKAEIGRRQGLNGVEEIIFSNPNFRLEGFEIDENYWNVVTSTDRAKVLVNINGVIVPFYLTTGQAGKGLVPGWYPFFGIGKDGWLNKTDKSDMETYYERYWGKETADIVKSISEELNSFYGTDPSAFKNDGDPNATSRPLSTLADKVEDYINSKLNYTPAINNADARKTLRSNVEQLGKEINDKYNAELKALEEQTTQTEEATSQEQPNPRIKEIQKEINSLKREINKLNPQAEISTVEALKARIEDILKLFKTSFVGTYDVDEAIKSRPDQKDIDRYNELKSNPLVNNFEVQKTFDVNLVSEKDRAILEEFQALKEKLSQWRVYDSLAEDEQSVADLLDILAQLETEVEEINTLTEPNIEDTFEELKKTATVDILELSVNTNYPVTVKRETNGNYSITHMNPSSLLQRMGATEVKIGKKEASFEEVDNQKKQGMKVTFISGGVPMSFEITERGRISIAGKDFQAIPNVKTIGSLSSWTYPALYEQDFEGKWQPIASDFGDDNITGDTNKLKEDDVVELFIDINNEYNQKLIQDKVKGDDLVNQVVIYIRKGGENYGTIKGLTQANRNELLGSEASIITLRELAAKALKEGKSGVLATTKVKYIQLGNPVLSIDGDGRIAQMPITDKGLEIIEAYGFVQDGEITLNKKVDDVRKSFIKKITEKNKGKKVPIVVIKRGAQMIAFPVQMVKTSDSKVEDLYTILDNTEKTDAQKVKAINDLLLQNGIAASEFDLITYDEQKIAAIEERLAANQGFKTAEQLIDKNYKKENLKNDVTIALDLDNYKVSLPSQKFNIDLEKLEYETLPDVRIEKQEVVEKVAEKEVETPIVEAAKAQVNTKRTSARGIKKHTVEFTAEDFQIKALPKPLADKIKKQKSKNKIIDYTEADLIALNKAGVVVRERNAPKTPKESKVADVEEAVKDKKAEEKFTPIDIDEKDIVGNVVSEMKVSEEELQQIAKKVVSSGLTLKEYLDITEDTVEKEAILSDVGIVRGAITKLEQKPELKPKSKESKSKVPLGMTFTFISPGYPPSVFTLTEKGVWSVTTTKGYPTSLKEKDTEFFDWVYNKSLNTLRTVKGTLADLKEEFNKEKELKETAEKLEKDCL